MAVPPAFFTPWFLEAVKNPDIAKRFVAYLERQEVQRRRADRGLPRLGRPARHRRGHQGRRQGRVRGHHQGAVERQGEGHQRRHRLHQAGPRRQGERAERAERVSRQDRRRQGGEGRRRLRRVPSPVYFTGEKGQGEGQTACSGVGDCAARPRPSPRGDAVWGDVETRGERETRGSAASAWRQCPHPGGQGCVAGYSGLHLDLRHHAGGEFHPRRALQLRRLHDVPVGDGCRRANFFLALAARGRCSASTLGAAIELVLLRRLQVAPTSTPPCW